MQAYKADTAWNWTIPCIFSKIIIQLYLSCSFLYYLTYCIIEVINNKIFWKINEKSVGLWGSYCLKQGNPLFFFWKHWSNCICFVYFYIFVKGNIFDIKFKSVGLWGSYGLKQGNPWQNIEFSNQIVFVLSPDLLFYLIYQKGYQR